MIRDQASSTGTQIPGYTPGSDTLSVTGPLGAAIPAYGSGTVKAPQYLGGGTDSFLNEPQFGRYGGLTGQTIRAPGYVNGDQVNLLPSNAADLQTLQLSLVQAGYITQAQAQYMVLGSPDEITTAAFAKLLATANYTHLQWHDALASRLAKQGAPAPEKAPKIPSLTITLSNPDDIKSVIQKSAQTLLGGNIDPAQADLFVQSIQRQQRDAQTATYYQEYTPTPGDPTRGTYGPGGTTVAGPTAEGVQAQAEGALKFTNPEQYQATQIGASVSTALDKLRTTGYL